MNFKHNKNAFKYKSSYLFFFEKLIYNSNHLLRNLLQFFGLLNHYFYRVSHL